MSLAKLALFVSLRKATAFYEVSILIVSLKALNIQMHLGEIFHSQWLCIGVTINNMWVGEGGGSILDFPFKSSKTLSKEQNHETEWLTVLFVWCVKFPWEEKRAALLQKHGHSPWMAFPQK